MNVEDENQEALVEEAAQIIYKQMQAEDPEGANYPWVPFGNSLKQDEARDKARKELKFDNNLA